MCTNNGGMFTFSPAQESDATCSAWTSALALVVGVGTERRSPLELTHVVMGLQAQAHGSSSSCPVSSFRFPNPRSGCAWICSCPPAPGASVRSHLALLQFTYSIKGWRKWKTNVASRETQSPGGSSLAFQVPTWPCSSPQCTRLLFHPPALLSSDPQPTWGQHTGIDSLTGSHSRVRSMVKPWLIYHRRSQHSSTVKQILEPWLYMLIPAVTTTGHHLIYRLEFTNAIVQQAHSANIYWAPTVCSLRGLSSP